MTEPLNEKSPEPIEDILERIAAEVPEEEWRELPNDLTDSPTSDAKMNVRLYRKLALATERNPSDVELHVLIRSQDFDEGFPNIKLEPGSFAYAKMTLKPLEADDD